MRKTQLIPGKTEYHLSQTILIIALLMLTAAPAPGCRTAQRRQQTALDKPTLDKTISPPRNILLITIDTLRADHLGCYGYSGVDTPAIDSLAAKGVRFELAFTPVPLTLPSHVTIMTGLYPVTHGVLNNGEFRLNPSARPLAQILHQQGFTTAAFVGAFVLSRQFGLDQGFDWFDDDLSGSSQHHNKKNNNKINNNKNNNPDKTGASPHDEAFRLYNERRGEAVSEASISWLRNKNPDRFFLWVHYFDPHTRYDPPEPFRSRYLDRPYDGEIAYTDHCIGLLLNELARRGQLDETLIILVADHGEGLGEHRESTHGIFLYEATVRGPLIMCYPALLPEGYVHAQPVKTLDILPTVLDILKIPQPPQIQGISLLTHISQTGRPAAAVFKGAASEETISEGSDKEAERGVIFLETRFPEANFGWSRLEGVRSRQWKYILAPRPELYNLSTDPHELHNVLDQYPKQAQRLKEMLDKFLARNASDPRPSQIKELDEETRARLQQLGYIKMTHHQHLAADPSGSPPPCSGSPSPPDSPDPKDMIDTLAFFDQGSEQYAAGQYQAAIISFRQVLSKDKGNIMARFLLGAALEKLGLLEQAQQEFQTVAAQDTEFINIHHNLGAVYEKLGQSDKAIAEYQMDIRLHPTGAVASYNNLGGIYLKQSRYQEAKEQFEKLLQLKPDLTTQIVAHTNLAIACEMLGQLDMAHQEYQRSLDLDPTYLPGLMGLGNIFLKTNHPEQAIQAWQKALEINPQNAEAHFNLGCTFLKLNRLPEAVEYLQEAVQQEPNLWQARLLLDQCRKQQQ
ncbi:MAG: sulfatase-like hydrolase/transferase [bacterium]|nr:sulfatase-like hydrolase/transferase [bacterium]